LGDGAASGGGLGLAAGDAAHFSAELAARGYGPGGRVLADELAAGGLLGARKQVPPVYLRGSAKQRLDLLQGLMDTDGGVTNGNGTAELCLADRALLAQAWELVCSLGHKPSAVRHRVARLPNGRSFDAWRFRWTPRDPVFRVPRK